MRKFFLFWKLNICDCIKKQKKIETGRLASSKWFYEFLLNKHYIAAIIDFKYAENGLGFIKINVKTYRYYKCK